MKRGFLVFLAVLFCFSAVACFGKEEGGLFKYDIEKEPVTLDPQLADDRSSLLVIQNIFEGLLTIGEDGKLCEGVARNWSMSEDGLQYTFQLREDAKWSNQTPVTADDFVFAFRRLFSSETRAPRASEFFCIKNAQAALEGKKKKEEIGVTSEGKYILHFQLETPNPMFLQLLTTAPAMPCNEAFFYGTKGKYGMEATKTVNKEKIDFTIGNGPFYLKTWSHGNYLALRRNEFYSGRKAAAALGVNFLIFEKSEETPSFEQAKRSRFESGETDAVVLTGEEYRSLKSGKYHSQAYQNTTYGILFNLKNAELSNSNIRKALFCLIDEKSYQQALEEDCTPAGGIIPPDITMLDVSFRKYAGERILPTYDVKKAKSYYQKGLSELGKEHLDTVSILVSDPKQEELFGYLSQIWQRELGLYAKVELLSVSELEQRIQSRKFALAFCPFSGSYNSPSSILSSFVTGHGNNAAGYGSRAYDNAISNGLKSLDIAKSAAYFKTAEQLLITDGVFLPVYYQQQYFVTAENVSDIQYFPQGELAAFMYAEKKE